jgi:tetratricopeptide (TPR) repeat protein
LALLLEICKVYPTHLPTLLLIGCTYYSLEHYELSIFYNKQIIARDPKFAEAYSNLGTTYRAMNRIEDAEACYRRAIALKPKYWDAICNLASLLNCSNRFDEAITFYESIVSIDKQGASIWTPERRRDIYFNIGNLRFLSGDVFKTKQDLLKALDAVGVRIGQQVPNLSVVVRSHETTASILQTLAKIFQDENAVNCAIACYYTALGLFPTANACNNLGILLSALGL